MTDLGGNDRLRELWQSDAWLTGEIPASLLPAENGFFEDGIGHFDRPELLPKKFVVINDIGDTTRTRASRKVVEVKLGYSIRICGGTSKPLTRKLASVFEGIIEAQLRGQEVREGIISDLGFESRQFQQIAGGLRLWTCQLTLTVHGRRPWQIQDVKVA